MKLRAKSFRVMGVLTLLGAFCAAGSLSVAQDDEEPGESDITRATASLLEHSQFSRRALDDQFSSQFLQHYVDALDGPHLLFLQSDRDEFDLFLPGLAQRTLFEGDTRLAHIIYTRYLERLAAQESFATNFLLRAKFDFSGTDSWPTDRREVLPPSDSAAAQALWREEVRADFLREKLIGLPAEKIGAILTRRYERGLKLMEERDDSDVLALYLDALAHVYDPHSDYFGHKDAENFNIELNLSLFGIGGALRIRNGYCVITELVPGGPAARSGLLKPGDRIVEIAQNGNQPVDVVGMSSPQVVELIRGPKGSTVHLTVIPAGSDDAVRKTVSLVRDEIDFSAARARAAIVDLPQPAGSALRVGVIKLPIFYENPNRVGEGASADVARLITKLQHEGVAGLILDLRGNGGGAVQEAVRLTGLFIPAGPVLQVLRPENEITVEKSPRPEALYDGPLVVLTSRLSASASEIVAGALKDYGRALIVGDSTTFGKGTVQAVVPLKEFFHRDDLGAVDVTIGKFYRPSGASTQLKGIASDIVLPTETDFSALGESKMPNALPWDTLPPTTYAKFDLVRPILNLLREKSNARVASDPAFQIVREVVAMAEQGAKAKFISLNEAERRSAKSALDGMTAELKNLAIAPSEEPRIYDIS